MAPNSGNVFADLGLGEPEGKLARAQLASRIQQIIRQRRLTQAAAARLMGVDQPKVSALLNGRLAHFSGTRFMRLTQLVLWVGRDSELVAHLLDERNVAVKRTIAQVTRSGSPKAHQGPSGKARR